MFRLAIIVVLIPVVVLAQLPPPFPGASQPCYDEEREGTQGWCEHDNCCEGAFYISNYCPNYPNQVKCCFSRNLCSVTEGCDVGGCNTVAQETACKILAFYEETKIYLKPNHFNDLGNNPYDGASVLSEVRDMCYNRKAIRSSYENAPGGCVCLGPEMLTALYDYAVDFYNTYGQALQVNSLAGSSHSPNSYHYLGNTMDIACTTPIYHCEEIEQFCRDRGAIELCYPGSSCGGHETWVHCAFQS